MKDREMDQDKLEKAKSVLALSLIAANHDLDAARALAHDLGVPFNRDSVIACVREFAGDAQARELARKWPLAGSSMSDVLARISKMIDYTKFQIASFAQYVTSGPTAVAGGFRGKDGAPVEPPEIVYALRTQDGLPVIDLRFASEIPESLRRPEAYHVFVGGQPLRVDEVRWHPALGADKIRLKLEQSPEFGTNAKCDIGLNLQTNELVGIFLSKRTDAEL